MTATLEAADRFHLSGSLAGIRVARSHATEIALNDPTVTSGPHRDGGFLLKLPSHGAFLVRDGACVDMAVVSGAREIEIQAILDGTVAAILMLQRGELPLHAATLLPPHGDGAVAIAGPSGIGKSTVAAALVQHGWRLIADDLTRVTVKDGRPFAWPGAAAIKLWNEACALLAIDTAGLPEVGARGKFGIAAVAARDPVPLGTVVALDAAETAARAVATGEAFALLADNTFRIGLVSALKRERQHLDLLTIFVRYCRVLRHPSARGVAPEIFAAHVERAITGTDSRGKS